MGVERIDVRTLADVAYDMLERAILNGDLAPGVALGEAELAGRLGISRGPLREAISRLEGRRLLTRIPHVGVRVIHLCDAEGGDIFAMREVLEGLAARLAAQRMTADEIDALAASAGFRHRKPTEGVTTAAAVRDDFHVRLVQGSRNARLIGTLCSDMYTLLRLYRIRSGSTPARAHAPDEHLEIVAAIRLRDADAAERLMRAHVTRARDSLNLDIDGTVLDALSRSSHG